MNKILIITGESQLKEENSSLGSAKDINYRINEFTSNNYSVTVKKIKGRSDKICYDFMKTINLKNFDIILFEHTVWPKSVKYCSKHHSAIYCRAHNAETLHSLDRIKSILKTYHIYLIFSLPAFIKEVIKIFKSLKNDFFSNKYATKLLICNENEYDKYWKYFRKKNIVAINTVTQVNTQLNYDEIEGKVILVGSYLSTPFSDFGLKLFISEAKIQQEIINNKYIIIGNYSYPIDFFHKNICYKGVIPQNQLDYEILSSSLVLIITPYGMGIKTKIYETLAHGKNLIMHLSQKNNIPSELSSYIHFWSGKRGTLFDFINTIKFFDKKDLVIASNRFKEKSIRQFQNEFKSII